LGEPAIVKEIALPFARWATLEVIEKSLREISRHTNVKWFRAADGRRYIHALSWEKHQSLELKKRGIDHLPCCKSTSSRRVDDEKSASGRRPNEKLKLNENDNENDNGNENKNEPSIQKSELKDGASPPKDDPNQLSPGVVPTDGEKPPRPITRPFKDSDVRGRKRGALNDMYKFLFGSSPLPSESDEAVTKNILAVPIEEQRLN